MSNVSPINFNISIKGTDFEQSSQRVVPSYADSVAQTNVMPNVHNASSQINARTPVSYNKIAEVPIPGVENKAQIYKLSNGQKVVLVKKDGPTIVQTSFKTGGFNEPDNLRGISHFIEHNLFNGSERLLPREYNQKLAQMGAYTNAYTSNNVTAYYIQSALGRENLEEIIKLNAEQVQFPTFPVDQMEKEKNIVCAEINMYDDDMPNVAKCSMIKELFGIDSTSIDLVAGNINNIHSLNREDLKNYYDTYYSPDNSTTIIVGDIDPEETMSLVSKYYTKQNPIKPASRNHEVLRPIESPKRVDIIRNNALGTSISVGFAGPENTNTKDRLALSLAINLLEGSKNSRLSKAMDKYRVSGNFEFEEIGNRDNDNTCLSYNITVPEENSEEILSTIYREIGSFLTNPPSQQEFEIAKRKLINGTLDSNETAEGLTGFIADCMRYDNKDFMSNYNSQIQSLTLNDVLSAVSKYMDLNKAAVGVVHPKDTTEDAILGNYAKNKSKVSFKGNQKQNKTMFDNVREYVLPNNMLVSVNPVTNTDKCIYTTKYTHPILKDMTSAEMTVLNLMLNSGSMYNDEQAFSDKLDKKDIELSFNVSPSSLSYSVRCPQGEMQRSFNALNEALFAPRFTQENLEKAIEKAKNAINSEPQSPFAFLMKGLFCDLHIGESNREMIEELDNLSLDRIKNLYSRIFQDAHASATLTAPLDQNPVLENMFTYNLMRTASPTKAFVVQYDQTFSENQEPKTFCSAEDTIQANVIQGYKYKRTGNVDDEAKIRIMNIILGAGMSSRLFLDLREKQKLAYSVNSRVEGLGDTGFICLSINTTTNNPNDPTSSPENITKSLDGFNKHINLMKTTFVSDEELERAKLILKNDLLSSVETKIDKTILLSESENSFYGKEHLKQMLDAIDKIKPEDIQACANYVFSQAPVTSIVASQDTLDALNLSDNQ